MPRLWQDLADRAADGACYLVQEWVWETSGKGSAYEEAFIERGHVLALGHRVLALTADAGGDQDVCGQRAQVGGEWDDDHVVRQAVADVDGKDERRARRVRIGGLAGQLDGPDLAAPGEGCAGRSGHRQSAGALSVAEAVQAASSARSASD